MVAEPEEIQLRGYFPGVIGRITEEHARFYHEQWGFDISFEIQVSSELAAFMDVFQERRDGLWVAVKRGEFAGCVAIDGAQGQGEGARLRWFIVVPKWQGTGIGRRLIDEAVDFSKRAGHRGIYLWTFEGLDAARSLYERAGFHLAEEHHVFQWGQNIKEQMFRLTLEASDNRPTL